MTHKTKNKNSNNQIQDNKWKVLLPYHNGSNLLLLFSLIIINHSLWRTDFIDKIDVVSTLKILQHTDDLIVMSEDHEVLLSSLVMRKARCW